MCQNPLESVNVLYKFLLAREGIGFVDKDR